MRHAAAQGLLTALALVASLQSHGQSGAPILSAKRSVYAQVDVGKEQLRERNFEAARSSYTQAVRSIEQLSGPASSALLEPLTGLADVAAETGQPRIAVEHLQRAIFVLRRSSGVYAVEQYPLLMRLVDLQSQIGDIGAAADNLRYMRRISEGEHGAESLRHAQELAQIADWQCRIGEFEAGRRLYRRSVALLEPRGGEGIDALLGLARCCLHELAREGIAATPATFAQYRGPVLRSGRLSPDSPAFTYHVARLLRPEGEAAVRRAAELAEANGVDPRRHVNALLQAGDWFQIKDHSRAARGYYAKVQTIAAAAGPDELFSAPVQLLYPVPSHALRGRTAPAEVTVERIVEVDLTVRADGRVDSERVVERDGVHKSAIDATLIALSVARFRPRVVDGNAIDTAGVRFRQIFRE